VEVEVVLGEAGQADGVVAQRLDAALGEAVRRDLHDEVGGAAGDGVGEDACSSSGNGVVNAAGASWSTIQLPAVPRRRCAAAGGGEHGGDEDR
jgi:hypothetical protein